MLCPIWGYDSCFRASSAAVYGDAFERHREDETADAPISVEGEPYTDHG